jgi:HTH-type transcriptional regulator / antitoxin HipB
MLKTTQDVATAVRQARKERGLTQAQLAQRAGVGRDWLVRLEKGNPRLELSKVLDTFTALGLSLSVEAMPTHESEPDPFASVTKAL